MPDITPQERSVSFYWAANYNPVTDVAGTGTYLLESGRIGYMVQMTDGSIWFDHDNDGWFDVGRRIREDGWLEEYDGSWKNLGPEEMETVSGALAPADTLLESDMLVVELNPPPSTTDWMFEI